MDVWNFLQPWDGSNFSKTWKCLQHFSESEHSATATRCETTELQGRRQNTRLPWTIYLTFPRGQVLVANMTTVSSNQVSWNDCFVEVIFVWYIIFFLVTYLWRIRRWQGGTQWESSIGISSSLTRLIVKHTQKLQCVLQFEYLTLFDGCNRLVICFSSLPVNSLFLKNIALCVLQNNVSFFVKEEASWQL